jgi:hypothetical protein
MQKKSLTALSLFHQHNSFKCLIYENSKWNFIQLLSTKFQKVKVKDANIDHATSL